MSRGFQLANVDVGILQDPKMVRLTKLVRDDGECAITILVYEQTMFESWRVGERVTAAEAEILWEPTQARVVVLKKVGLLDDEGRVTESAWEKYYGAALARSQQRSEAGRKGGQPESFDLDEALEAAKQPRTAPGDLWHLGDHRLLYGDATKPEDVARVLDGKQADLCFTDPPYNVAMGDHGGHGRGRRKRRIANDALPPDEWEAFMRGWVTALLPRVDGALYVCMSSKEWPTLARVLLEEGAHWSDTLIWRKDRFVIGRADYQRAYEPIWYGWRDGAKRVWNGGRDQDDVWHIARPSESPLHPTTKPLPLIERAIENSSDPGALVLDPFMGSGSTLIACERTGRINAGVELDPRYCDVIIARWEAFTGLTAEKET
jgi:DNA modification methylase